MKKKSSYRRNKKTRISRKRVANLLQASFGDSKQIKTDHKKCGIIING